MTVGEIADYLRISRSTVYQIAKRGELPAFKIGSDWRCNRSDLERWCLSQTQGADRELHQAVPA
jgi:excisionase family DNA binding protein